MSDRPAFSDAFDEFRHRVYAEAPSSEPDLASLLYALAEAARADLRRHHEPQGEEEAYDELSRAEAWASLASYAAARFYVDGPGALGAAFMKLPGVSNAVVKALRAVTDAVRPTVAKVYRHTGAESTRSESASRRRSR